MQRKKRLRIIQASLFLIGAFVVFFTFYEKKDVEERIISEETQLDIEKSLSQQSENADVFYNIEYSGLDLAGNRYILKSNEASNKEDSQEIVNMITVEAIFFFKDGTTLSVFSDEGIYNNKTLDMIFRKNVKAFYEGSELYAQKAEYSNSESFLIITENVKLKDVKGEIFADKLLFDIKSQKLNIASINDNKINANINIK